MSPDLQHVPEHLKSRYKDFELLGAGAMGRVFKATDSILLIDVAIKVLLENRHIRSESAVRFQQEAKAVSKLQHKNILTIMDFGITDGGEPYIVMEFIKGKTLAEIFNTHEQFTLAEATNIIGQICDGMEHAHKVGVIHRDLKPANIMVLGDDLQTATIRILDFGIAKYEERLLDTTGSATPSGTLLGSPQYMSPEQVDSRNIDSRSDIYSVGCILFQIITGRHAHERDSTITLLQAKREEAAPRINSVFSHNPVPPAVEEVVAKCLETDPADRFKSMLEFKQALFDAVDADECAPDLVENDRSKKPMIVVSIALLLLIGGFSFVIFRPVFLIEDTPPPVVARPRLGEKQVVLKEQEIKDASFVQDLFKIEQDGRKWTAIVPVVTDSALAKLSLFPKIEELYLKDQEHISKKGYEYIAALPNLRNLQLAEARIKDEDLEPIGKAPNLLRLGIDGTAVTDRGISHLANSFIVDLNLERTALTDEGLQSVGKMTKLDRLLISNTRITDRGLKYLKHMKINSLHLEGCAIGDEGLKYLPGMMEVKHPTEETPRTVIDRLYLGQTNISVRGLKSIQAADLRELFMSNCRGIDDEAVALIARAWPKLEVLTINDTSATSASIKHLAKLHGLRELGVAALGLTDEDMLPLLKLEKLESLNISANPLTDETLYRLMKMPETRRIDLTHCKNITAEGLRKCQIERTDVKFTAPELELETQGTTGDIANMMNAGR